MSDYHDFYVQRDQLILADVFQNFQTKCTETYELDPAHFLSASGLAWQVFLKKMEIVLELLTHIVMLQMVEQEIRCGICHGVYRYATVNNSFKDSLNA